jgi:hypothetical protein
MLNGTSKNILNATKSGGVMTLNYERGSRGFVLLLAVFVDYPAVCLNYVIMLLCFSFHRLPTFVPNIVHVLT